MKSILEVRNVTSGYKDATVIFDISFDVLEGTVTAIVGRNGAGKTTLLKTIAGFVRQSKGEVIFDGKDVTRVPPHERASAGLKYVRQDKRVFGDLTVGENLELAAYPRKDYDSIPRALEIFPKLKGFVGSKAGTLSGGERQMLLLSQGLLGNAKILLLDEPTEGLAPVVIKELERSFGIFKELNKTIVLVEQNLGVVRSFADQVYAMKEGRMVLKGIAKENLRSVELEAYL